MIDEDDLSIIGEFGVQHESVKKRELLIIFSIISK